MPDQGERHIRRSPAQEGDEIDEVILELADIADIAARARGAVAAHVEGPGLHPTRGERRGQRVIDRTARAGGAMDEDGAPPRSRPARRIMAEAEPGAVAGLKTLEGRQGRKFDSLNGLRN